MLVVSFPIPADLCNQSKGYLQTKVLGYVKFLPVFAWLLLSKTGPPFCPCVLLCFSGVLCSRSHFPSFFYWLWQAEKFSYIYPIYGVQASVHHKKSKEVVPVETAHRVYICPRGNLPYIWQYPINNTISTLNNTKCTHHKLTLNPDLPYNRLPYKQFLL